MKRRVSANISFSLATLACNVRPRTVKKHRRRAGATLTLLGGVALLCSSCTGHSNRGDWVEPDARPTPSCIGQACTAEVIADLQSWPGALASDSVDLFWINRGLYDDLGNIGNGAIMARPMNGGDVRVVVPELRGDRLAVLNDYVYWISKSSVWRAPKDGSGDKALVYESSETVGWIDFTTSDNAIVVLDSIEGSAHIITIASDTLVQSVFPIGPGRAWSLSVSNQSAYAFTGVEGYSAERELLAISLADGSYSVLSVENEALHSIASDDDYVFLYYPGSGIGSRSLDTDDYWNLFRDYDDDSSLRYPITNIEVTPTTLIASYGYSSSMSETGLWIVPKIPGPATHLLHQSATHVNGTLVIDGELYWSESMHGEPGTIRKYHLPE